LENERDPARQSSFLFLYFFTYIFIANLIKLVSIESAATLDIATTCQI